MIRHPQSLVDWARALARGSTGGMNEDRKKLLAQNRSNLQVSLDTHMFTYTLASKARSNILES